MSKIHAKVAKLKEESRRSFHQVLLAAKFGLKSLFLVQAKGDKASMMARCFFNFSVNPLVLLTETLSFRVSKKQIKILQLA